MVSLNVADTYSLSSNGKIQFQTCTNLNASAFHCQTLYQPHTAIYIGPSETILSSSSSVYPTNPSPVILQKFTVPFASLNKSFRNFDELDHQYTPEKFLQQNDAHVAFTMGEREKPLNHVAFKQGHKRQIA